MEISDVHKNSKLLIDGVPYNVDDVDFVKPGKGRAIYRLRLRNLIAGGVVDRTFHSGEKVDEASIGTVEKQYLYREGDHYVFMDTGNYEQIFITEEQLGDKRFFLKEGMIVTMQMMGERPIDITLPITVEMKIAKSGVMSKSDTITAQYKAVELESGFTIQVPAFINEGDTIKVDTRTGQYLERVTKK
jgi:elongation factor P